MKKIVTILFCVFCASCSLNLSEAELSVPDEYLFGQGYNTGKGEICERWWESFGDEKLNCLVEQSLRDNRDLMAAAAKVESARYYLRVAESEFLPSLNMEAIAELTHEEGVTEHEYTIAPAISWELSLFGQMRNTKRAARAEILQREWSYRGVELSLSAQVATTYFTLLKYQRSLYIATRSFELRCDATALIDSMYRYGMSSGTDLMQAKSLVYSASSEMQRYQRAVATTTLSLSTLLGQTPREVDWRSAGRALIHDELPFDIPIGLPSSLLERRADVMQSYFAMAQAAANVGVSRAQRYPSISLTGSGGVFATSLEGLTSNDPLLWSFTGEIVAPIFKWRALKNKELMARESYIVAVKEYEQSILTALSDVESALATINTCGSQAASSSALVMANTKIVENTTALYRSGLGDYLSVIDSERELYSSQIALVDVVAQQYINYINLIKALGGGW